MSYLIIPCFRIKPNDYFEHPYFLKVNIHLINSQKMNSNYNRKKNKIKLILL